MAQDWKAPSYAKPVDEKETVDSSTWNKRPDGSAKGKGFLGVFKLPNGEAASEYSIADSEKLKDAKGNYLDYPSLVPTLTKDELRQALDAANRGVQPPDRVKIKAEAYALERKKAGKPLFANDGEQNESLHSDIPRLNVTNSDTDNTEEWQPPSYAKAEEEPGVLDKIGEFAAKHPKTREIAERLLTGTSAEHEKLFKDAGIRNGTNAQEGSLLPDWKSQPENYWGGFAKSIYNDFVKPLGTPSGILGSSGPAKIPFKVGEVVPDLNYPIRPEKPPISNTGRLLGPARTTVSPKGNAYVGELPVRGSVEKPYRSPESYSTVFDTKDKSQIKPKINVPESGDLPIKQDPIAGMDTFHKASFTAVGDEDIFNADRPRQGVGDVEQTLYDHNKKKLGGKQTDDSPLDPNRPTAIYAFEQPGLNGESTSMYHIKGGDYDRSTVSGKRLEELGIDVPDREYKPPQAMRVSGTGGKNGLDNIAVGGADPAVLDALSESLYTKSPDLIATKELIQNANDEHRESGQGDTPIRFAIAHGDIAPDGEKANSIIIQDKGRGLTQQQLYNEFTDVGKTGKGDTESASGGFGFAKASPLLGGHYVDIKSVVKEGLLGKKVQYSFSGNPEQLKNQAVGVSFTRKEVDSNTPTGLRVQVWHKDASARTYEVPSMVKSIAENSFNASPVEFKEFYLNGRDDGNGERKELGRFMDGLERENKYLDPHQLIKKDPVPPKVETLELPNASVDIHYFTPNPDRAHHGYTLHILNKGLWQQKLSQGYGLHPVPNVPESIYVNVRSKIKEGQKGYPFGLNREQLQEDPTFNAIKQWIQKNIVSGALEKAKNQLQKLYDSMNPIRIGSSTARPTVFFDSGARLTSTEKAKFVNSPIIKTMASVLDRVADQALKDINRDKWIAKLEKTGVFLVEKGFYGLHVENPASRSEKSTIVVNGFAHALDNPNDPMATAVSTIETMLHELGHIGNYRDISRNKTFSNPEDVADPYYSKYISGFFHQIQTQGGGNQGHEVDWLQRLGEVYVRYSPSKFKVAADEIYKVISAGDGEYSPEFQELLQIYEESRGRVPVTEDILSRTGVKQAGPRKPKGNVSSDSGSPGKRTAAVVRKLLDALQKAKELNIEQEQINRKERAKRFGAFESVKAEGQEGAAKSLSKLRGRYEKVEGNRLQLDQKDVDTLFTAIKNANITTPEKIQSYVALFKLIDGGNALQRNEIRTLDDVFGDGFAERIIHLQGGIGAVGIKVAKVANTMKSMLTLIHLSAPLRQGIGLIHKPAYREAFVEMFKFLGNKERYDAAMKAIEEDPMYLLLRQGGLFLAKTNSMLDGEEQFLNNYIPNLPSGVKSLGLKNVYDASQRSYLGFLNVLRFQTAKDLINDAKKFGHHAFTVEESVEDGEVVRKVVPSKSTENIAKFVNISTGRGSLGFLDKITPEINTVIWSPRLIASRLTVLNPRYYWTMDSFTRKEAIKSLLAIAAASSAMIGLAKLAGGKVSNDPTSADFHKARFKNSVLDPNGGFQQPVVAAARMINEVNRMSHGRKAGYTEENIPEIAVNFIRSKESPMAGLIDDLASAKYFTGSGGYVNRFGARTSVQTEITNRFRPIFEQDMTKLLQDDQDFMTGLGLSAANLFGAGLQDYPEKHPKGSLSMNKLRVR